MARTTRAFLSFTLLGLGLSLPADLSAQRRSPPVVTFTAIRQNAAAGHTFIGTTRPVKRTTIGSAVDGRVVEVTVEEGDPVKLVADPMTKKLIGQTLVQLRTKTISIQVKASEAQLKLREHELKELQNGARPEEKAQAKAKLESAKSGLKLADAHYKRTLKLYENGRATTLDMLDRARTQSQTAKQTLLDAQASYDLVIKGPRKERIEQARARKAAQQAEVERLREQKSRYSIRAPFVGYVTVKHTEVGSWISKGDPVVDIVALDPIEVDVAVPERYISYLRPGAKTQVRLEAIANHVFTGTVHRIVPQAREQSRTFPVRVRIKNPKQKNGLHLIRAGMLAHATLSVGAPASVVLVHKDALVLGGRRPRIFVLNEGKVVPQDVDLGIAVGSLIEVRGRIQEGAKVVVQGNERLRPGQAVRVVGEIDRNGKKVTGK